MTFPETVFNLGFIRLNKMSRLSIICTNKIEDVLETWFELKVFKLKWKLFKKSEILKEGKRK